jgi:hypothetical protein
MRKWIPIFLGSIGCFFILKTLFKFDKSNNTVVVAPANNEEVRRAIPVIIKAVENPAPNASDALPARNYLQSSQNNINSKR